MPIDLAQVQLRLDEINPDFYFDLKTRRFRARAGGRFVSRAAARGIAERYLDRQQRELIALADDAYSGRMTLREFQLEASLKLKQIHLSQAFIGKDGTDRITPGDFLTIAREMKVQYTDGVDKKTGRRFGIKHLAADLDSGAVTSVQQLKERLRKFGNSGKYTFWAMRMSAAIEAGKTQAKRSLNSQKECQSCRAFAALGYQSITRLVLPTKDCECGTNCLCTVQFR